MMGLAKFISSVGKNLHKNTLQVRVLGRSYCDSPCVGSGTKGEGHKDESDQKVDGSKPGAVVGVFENDGKFDLTPQAEELNAKSGGKLCQHITELSCRLKLGTSFVVTDVVPEYSAVAISSYGPRGAAYNKLEELDEFKENVRWGSGAGSAALAARGVNTIQVDTATCHAAASEGAHLAVWRFEEFKNCADRCPSPSVSMLGTGGGGGEGGRGGGGGGQTETVDTWEMGGMKARAQNWARYLSDMPANKMGPIDLAQAALDMLCPLGVTVLARDRSWIESQRMESFLAVARGSCETPVFLECIYRGGGQRPPVLLAAKGVTFDSGGLCLKRPEDMVENRGSMAGAAVALATLKAIAELKVPINVCCVIPLCENMISGQCMKVGDVVRALNGLSIQIEDTDMEGRLMLADALVYGQSVHKPSLVIDIATLTRGVLMATGGGAFGCFSNNEAAWRALRDAGRDSGDRPWRFPLWTYYTKQITNETSVDLRNKGSGRATPCLGAAFLRNFVCGDWLHMDITGVGKLGHTTAPPYLHARRMTGRPTRTLIGLLQAISKCQD